LLGSFDQDLKLFSHHFGSFDIQRLVDVGGDALKEQELNDLGFRHPDQVRQFVD